MCFGFYRRHNLTILLISIGCTLVLFIVYLLQQNISLLDQNFNNYNFLIHAKREETSETKQIRLEQPSRNAPFSIKFLNSELIDINFDASNIIPIIVLSLASNIELRDAIRRTWGFKQSYKNGTVQIKVLFLVGTDDLMMKRIYAEQLIFGDVIQVSIPDIYSFFAYKELSALVWVRKFLPNARFYIKTEDNVIINMKAITKILLPAIEHLTNESLVIGWFSSRDAIQRGSYQKFVDAVVTSFSMNLTYAMSLLYVITSKAGDRMLYALAQMDIISYPGDPFLTGILRETAHVRTRCLTTFSNIKLFNLHDRPCSEVLQNNSDLLFCTTSSAKRIVPQYFAAWNIILNQN